MSRFSDLLGTTRAYFKIGIDGVRLKNNAANLVIRNSADAADAEITASKVNASGDVGLVVNSDSAGSGADWKITLQRPAAGMTADVLLTLPIDDGTAGQVLQTDGSGVLSWASSATTGHADKIDNTALAFGTASPVTMFTTGAGDTINKVEVIIDTAFTGSPSLSIGIAGTTSKYLSATDVDLTQAAGTVFEVCPGIAAAGVEAIIATYVAGGAGAGAARMRVYFATPV